jgi:RHS repeat-associated protein
LASRRSALRTHCACAVEQHYEYRWDELNRLDEARRYDRASGGPWTLEVRQRYRYDSANQRTVKQTLAQDGCVDPPDGSMIPCERTALYVYPGDFERRGLVSDRIALEYASDGGLPTETQYVIGGARTVFRHGATGGSGFERDQRLVVPVGDLIQTTSAAFDVRTGELLEASTYYPNGARETYLQRDDALVAPEPSGFTGKEADAEVGLVYFGERYLIPRLGRWASPDPLHVHAVGGGEVLNSYHYISGNLLKARDILGLWPDINLDQIGRNLRRYAGHVARAVREAAEDPEGLVEGAALGVADAVSDGAASAVADAATARGHTERTLRERPAASHGYVLGSVLTPVVEAVTGAGMAVGGGGGGAVACVPTAGAGCAAAAGSLEAGAAMVAHAAATAPGAFSRAADRVDETISRYDSDGVNPDEAPPDNPDGDTPEAVSRARQDALSDIADSEAAPPPTEAYSRERRERHYGRTPTRADREALGAAPDELVDHDPPLVRRFHEGDPEIGEPPGHLLSPEGVWNALGGARARRIAKPRSRRPLHRPA